MLGRPSAFLSVSCIEIVDHTAVQDVAVSTHDNRLRSHFRLSDSANLLVLIKDSGQIDLVLADMVFIDVLSRAGVVYDYTKRRIHPLFASLDVDVSEPVQLKALLYANASYCLLGDTAPYQELGASKEALAGFCDK